MKDFLLEEVKKARPEVAGQLEESLLMIRYSEDINPDAVSGSEQWLKNRTSFIWKTAVLTLIDANKCDWVYVAYGTQRDEKAAPLFVGVVYFDEGENDDIGRVMERFNKLLLRHHPVFDPE